MTNRPEVVGIVMAAGGSTRFGSPKQLLPYGNTTLLGHIVDLVNASTLEQIVVVLGREAEQVRGSVDWGRAAVVDNLAYGTGCASSLLAGLDTAGDCAAIMLLLGDQPGIRTQDIDQVHKEWLGFRPWAAATEYKGKLGHPLVFSNDSFNDLRALHGDKAVWNLIEHRPERVARVTVDADFPPDIDTIEDYQRMLETERRMTIAHPIQSGPHR